MSSQTLSKILCISLFFPLSTAFVAAQPSGAPAAELTVHDAFESALSLNPEIKAGEQRIQALTYKREAADSLTAQPLSLEGSYRSDGMYNNQGLREFAFGVSAPVWNWNERSFTQAIRSAELEEAESHLQKLKLELAGHVREVVWNTLSVKVDVEIAKARVAAAKDLQASVKKRLDAGELAQTDLYQALVLVAQAEAELGRSMGVLAEVSAEYTVKVGLPVDPAGEFAPESAQVPSDLKPSDHPELKFAEAQLRVNESQQKLTSTQARPNLEIGLSMVAERSTFASGQDKSIMVSTRIPLGSSSDYSSRVLDAQANSLAAKTRLANVERALVSKGRVAEYNLDVFSKLTITAKEQSDLAQKVYQLHRKAFELGETDLLTLLRFEQSAFEASRLSRKSTIEYAAKVSMYRQSLGLLP